MRRILTAMVAIGLVPTFVLGKGVAKTATTNCFVPKDEVQVLVSYFKWVRDREYTTVVITNTELPDVDVDYANLRLATIGHGVPVDVRTDLKSKATSECRIRPITGIPNLQFISKTAHDEMFRSRTAWSKFRKRFGKNAELRSVSRVGFNAAHSIAMFYVTGGIGPMAASCSVYVFRRQNGEWIKDSEAILWTS